MATDNATILDRVWLNGTNDFQQRIPQPTQQQISKTIDALFDPMNKNYYNQFVDSLIMRIGMTYVRSQSWKNRLAAFKDGKMNYGATEQEIMTKWVKAHSYKDDAEDVFKMMRPESVVAYHSQNRRDQYGITVDRQELMSAFTDEYGINAYIASIMQTPINADEYDEYRIMMQLLAFYDNKYKFYRHHLSGMPTDEATGKEFLKAVKTDTELLQFPRTIYNGVRIDDLPVFAKPEELVLLMTPDIAASVDVDTLAPLFHLDKAQISARRIIVDEFPFGDGSVAAILTTTDFFRCRDTVYQTDSVYNPKTLGTNYYLNHWGIYSVSPFVPAIVYTTDAATTTTTVKQTFDNVTIALANEVGGEFVVTAGGEFPITVTANGSLVNAEGTSIELAPKVCTYEIDATSGSVGSTYVDEYAVLHVAKGVKTGTTFTITGTPTYVNPSGENQDTLTPVTINVKVVDSI